MAGQLRIAVTISSGQVKSYQDEVFRQAHAASTWTFLLEPLDDGESTRHVVHWQARWDLLSSPTLLLIGVVLDPIEFIMEQKMMRGIKQWARAAPGEGNEGAAPSTAT